MNLKTEIQINAPIEKVFEVFTDIENLDKNVESITKVEILKGEGKMKRFRSTISWIQSR